MKFDIFLVSLLFLNASVTLKLFNVKFPKLLKKVEEKRMPDQGIINILYNILF